MGGALDPTVAKARNLVRDNLADLEPGARLVVAVSGGADSLALAATTAFVAAKQAHDLEAVIIDHQLQAGSSAVATEALDRVRSLGIAGRVVTVDVGGAGGMEAAARRARQAVFDSLDADAVLLGHTLDDQAETVLLGLGRGSGARSIAGMAPVEGRSRRPFLGLTGEETRSVCRASGLSWWTDPHNADPAFTRVRLRREVLPLLEDVLGGGVAKALARTADFLRADNDFLDELAGTHTGSLSASELAGLAPAIRGRVLRTAALAAGADASELAAHHLRGVDELITRWHGQERIELPGGVAAARVGDALTFGPTPVAR